MVQYQCKRCKKVFKQKIDYTRHRRRKHKCDIVRAQSARNSLNGAEKFKCQWCNKIYTSKGVLNRHINQSCQVLKALKNQNNFGADSAPLDKDVVVGTVSGDKYTSQGNVENLISSKNDEGSSKTDESSSKNDEVKCKYCKVYKSRSNISKHLKICKEKEKHELKKIIEHYKQVATEKDMELRKLKDIQKERDDLEKEYFEFMKEMAIKTNTKIIFNDNKRCVNMYFIMNNYTEARNMEALMDPEISKTETKMIKGSSVQAGVFNFIKHRCIDNVDLENRPFHCVDDSRNKYLLYTGDAWKIDKNGDNIIGSAIDKIRSIYDTKIERGDSKRSMEEKLQNISDLLDLEKTGRKKIMKELNKITLIKNTINYTD